MSADKSLENPPQNAPISCCCPVERKKPLATQNVAGRLEKAKKKRQRKETGERRERGGGGRGGGRQRELFLMTEPTTHLPFAHVLFPIVEIWAEAADVEPDLVRLGPHEDEGGFEHRVGEGFVLVAHRLPEVVRDGFGRCGP